MGIASSFDSYSVSEELCSMERTIFLLVFQMALTFQKNYVVWKVLIAGL